MKSYLPAILTHPDPINAAARRELGETKDQMYPSFDCPTLSKLSINEIKDRLAKERREAKDEILYCMRHGAKCSFAKQKLAQASIMFRDLTGEKIGRFFVVGLVHFEGRFSAWALKCECGRFDIFVHRFLLDVMRKFPESNLECSYCKVAHGINKKLILRPPPEKQTPGSAK